MPQSYLNLLKFYLNFLWIFCDDLYLDCVFSILIRTLSIELGWFFWPVWVTALMNEQIWKINGVILMYVLVICEIWFSLFIYNGVASILGWRSHWSRCLPNFTPLCKIYTFRQIKVNSIQKGSSICPSGWMCTCSMSIVWRTSCSSCLSQRFSRRSISKGFFGLSFLGNPRGSVWNPTLHFLFRKWFKQNPCRNVRLVNFAKQRVGKKLVSRKILLAGRGKKLHLAQWHHNSAGCFFGVITQSRIWMLR